MTTPPNPARPEPFSRASLFIGPLLEAYGFRLIAREYAEEEEGTAMSEYRQGDLAIRLIWEGTVRAIWVETARASGGSIISRWVDIEWSVAGKRLPLDTGLEADRLQKLATAIVAFLSRGIETASAGTDTGG
jgi:hypothetical protein